MGWLWLVWLAVPIPAVGWALFWWLAKAPGVFLLKNSALGERMLRLLRVCAHGTKAVQYRGPVSFGTWSAGERSRGRWD